MSLITLQTDFGTRDAFVGIMKGVILGIDPELRVVDLSHHIPPFDLRLPGLNWVAAVPYFPSGTVHVAVVDPGVGTDRDIIVAVIHDQLFLCPDNGLLTPVIEEFGAPKECYTVENLSWRAKPP
ncbi:MAG TPA: SAM-dependent chlorinase/fluorinase, partial [bacterium]|nr:SAM-dependent chlorinase/fluorinase [bacterium]